MITILKKKKWKAIYILNIPNPEFYERFWKAMKIPRRAFEGGKMVTYVRKAESKVKNGDKKEMNVIARTKLGARREAKIKAAYASLAHSGVNYKLESLVLLK